MTQKEPITLLGRHTTVANGDSHYEGYNGSQAVRKFTITRTNTTGNPSIYHLHAKHYMIHHPGQQTEAE